MRNDPPPHGRGGRVCGTGQGAGGATGVRTPDLLNAIQTLFQLSYSPIRPEAEYSAGERGRAGAGTSMPPEPVLRRRRGSDSGRGRGSCRAGIRAGAGVRAGVGVRAGRRGSCRGRPTRPAGSPAGRPWAEAGCRHRTEAGCRDRAEAPRRATRPPGGRTSSRCCQECSRRSPDRACPQRCGSATRARAWPDRDPRRASRPRDDVCPPGVHLAGMADPERGPVVEGQRDFLPPAGSGPPGVRCWRTRRNVHCAGR